MPGKTKTAVNKSIISTVLGLTLAATALRFYGIHWGLPNVMHAYSYHPDEFLTVGASLNVISERSLNPHFYNYPSLFIYLCSLVYEVAMGYGVKFVEATPYFLARYVTASMGIFSVLACWWAGRRFFGAAVGLLGAAFVLFMPIHVQHSHFATVDVPCTLFVALALGFAAKIMSAATWKNILLGGVMCGLAAGTKYNAGVVILSVVAAILLSDKIELLTKLLRTVGAIAAAGIAFVIITPGSVLYTQEFIHGITYELRHSAAGHGLVFAGTGNGFLYTLLHSWPYGFGPGVVVLFIAGLVLVVANREKRLVPVIAFVLPYCILISMSQVRFVRYGLPAAPAVVIICGWVIWRIYHASWRWKQAPRALAITLTIAVLVINCMFSLALDGLFAKPDPRDQAARWILSDIKPGSSIALMDLPWFYSPPLSSNLGFGTVQTRNANLNTSPYRLTVMTDTSANNPDATNADWSILSDYETDDALRLRNNNHLSTNQQTEVRAALAKIAVIDSYFTPLRVFESTLSVASITLGNTRSLPHDMRYVTPTITVYKARR